MVGMKALCLAVCLLTLTPRAKPQERPAGDSERGASLYRSCLAAIRLDESTTQAPPVEIQAAAECANYVDGFVAGTSASGTVCKGTASNGTLIRRYLAYMQKAPQLMDEAKPVGLYIFLSGVYPCAKPTR